jgi:predicted metal-dependent enzyme (double-stranded beta helix superfamily)
MVLTADAGPQLRTPERARRGSHRRLGAERLISIARAFVREAELLAPSVTGQREWALLGASEDAEVWVIAWAPGGAIELHDHGGSWGALVVVSGELVETSVAFVGDSGEVGLRRRSLGAGQSLGFGSTHVHDIVNRSAAPAISVHAYAPRLTSMTYYRVEDGDLMAERVTRYALGHATP